MSRPEKELRDYEEAMALKVFVSGESMTEKERAHLDALRQRSKKPLPFAQQERDPSQASAVAPPSGERNVAQ